MAAIKQVVGTRTALGITISTLAAATYATSAAKNNTTTQPLDLIVELTVTPGTTTGNKQALLFARASTDGVNYQTGPTSGNSAIDEPNLTFIGALPLNNPSVLQLKAFSVAMAYGGVLPPYLTFVVKNDSGVAFTAGGMFVSEVSATVI